MHSPQAPATSRPRPGVAFSRQLVVAPGDIPVLIVTGTPGVGKTATARILARRSDRAVHLESDAFFHFIRSGFVAPWKSESHEQNRVVMGIVAEAAAAYALAGYFTIIDGIVLPRWFLAPLGAALRDAGLACAYAVLRAPLSVCAARGPKPPATATCRCRRRRAPLA